MKNRNTVIANNTTDILLWSGPSLGRQEQIKKLASRMKLNHQTSEIAAKELAEGGLSLADVRELITHL